MQNKDNSIPGISITDVTFLHDIKVTRVEVKTTEAAEVLGKPIGNYITLEFPQSIDTQEICDTLTSALTDELRGVMGLKDSDSVLVVGIGNRDILADSFGPRTVEQVEVTAHLIEHGLCETRKVSAICPGVMGQTGIETFRIIQSVVKEVKPDCVIVVDALCSKDLSRLATTIQIADTGISPGAGLGTAHTKIDRESLGVPVYAIGVPMVVEVANIIADGFGALDGIPISTIFGEAELDEIIRHKMKDIPNGDAALALKDCDDVVATLSAVVANAINTALLGGFK